MPFTKTCPQCGRTFSSSYRAQKFCSRQCYWTSMRTPVTREELDYWYNELGETTEQIGQRLGIAGRTVRDLMEKFSLPRRGKAEAAFDYPRRSFSGDAVEEAYLRGFRAGDLNVRRDLPTSQTICVRCGTTRSAQVDLIRSLFEPYGHVHTRLGTQGETQVECHLDMSFSFLLEKEDCVLEWVMQDDDCFWAFLAGYIDAEGYIGINRRPCCDMARVEVASCDEGILRGLWAGLNARGVRCPQLYLKKRAGTVDRQGRRCNRDFYRLSISRKASLDRFFRGIDPYLKHADKRTAMTRAWANVRERGLTVHWRRIKTKDERLENGSVVYWSRRFKDGKLANGKTRWRVPVRCGGCGEVRKVDARTVQSPRFTGLCRSCAQSAKKTRALVQE